MTPQKSGKTLQADIEHLDRPFTTPQPEFDYDRAPLPLTHYVWILKRSKWKISGFIATCMLVTFLVCMRLTPIYESTVRVDVDRRAPAGIVGQESMQNTNGSNDTDEFINTQVELIQSDGVLRRVNDRFRLLEHENQLEGLHGEKLDALRAAPIKLKRLKVFRPPNSFILRISYRSPDPRLAADVANAVAQSYLEHTYDIRAKSGIGLSSFMERQIDQLKAKMETSNKALAGYERELNVVNPEEKTNILSARLLQLNTEYTTAQASRVLKETAAKAANSGSLAAIQISEQAEPLAIIQAKIQDLEQRIAELKSTYGPNYSEYRRAASQLQELSRQYSQTKAQISNRIEMEYRQAVNREELLRRSVAETKADYDKLTLRSLEYQQLKDEATADKKLYEELVTRIREAGINAGFQNSTIRIADIARPAAEPVFPKPQIMLLSSLVLSALLGYGAAVAADMADNTVKEPDQITREIGVPVIGLLPAIRKADLPTFLAPSNASSQIAARDASSESTYRSFGSFEEAIRTLRNSIMLADLDRRVKSLLITSASPAEGKSTTALYLAIANAVQGKRTLLIDADLRKPSVHRSLALSNAIGLSSALTGMVPWREAVQTPSAHNGLGVISAGPAFRRASDLIGEVMIRLLDEAVSEYDLIIVDAPPLLGFAEPLQLVSATDGVLIVARAGVTPRRAVGLVVATLMRFRAQVLGLVLNQVTNGMTDEYYLYKYSSAYYPSTNGSAA